MTTTEASLYAAALDEVDNVLSGWRRGLAAGQPVTLDEVVKLRQFVQEALGWAEGEGSDGG